MSRPRRARRSTTAAAMIAILRYGSGVPFQRLERLQADLGIPLPAATQWELVESATEGLRPAYDEFIRQAAQGEVAHNDDTGMRILQLTREPTPKGKAERTGVFTSGIVSRVGVWLIALFFSGWKHAGENLADVLKQRTPGLAPLIQMCSHGLAPTSRYENSVASTVVACTRPRSGTRSASHWMS